LECVRRAYNYASNGFGPGIITGELLVRAAISLAAGLAIIAPHLETGAASSECGKAEPFIPTSQSDRETGKLRDFLFIRINYIGGRQDECIIDLSTNA
jgi:hypothetical protein